MTTFAALPRVTTVQLAWLSSMPGVWWTPGLRICTELLASMEKYWQQHIAFPEMLLELCIPCQLVPFHALQELAARKESYNLHMHAVT